MKRPPLGAVPYHVWAAKTPNPTVVDLLARFVHVTEAIHRCRLAKVPVNPHWLEETGIVWITCPGGYCEPSPWDW